MRVLVFCLAVLAVSAAAAGAETAHDLKPYIKEDAMQELAEHGAKVLHAQAVEWARRAGIIVHAVSTASPPVAGVPAQSIEPSAKS